jgi:hypothetical protein
VPVLFIAMLILWHLGISGLSLTAVWIAIFADLDLNALFNPCIFFRGKWQDKTV